MFFRSKPEKAKDKSVAKAKSMGDAAATHGASLTTSVLSSAASALSAVSDSVAPKAAAAATSAKEKSEVARAAAMDRTEGARAAAKDRTEGARAAAMDRTAGAREVAREKAGDALSRAAVARDSAVSSLDKGIDSAVPVMQQGVAGVGDKVDSARDVIVDDVLPKLQEMLGNLQAQKDEALAKPEGAIAMATGAPKKGRKKGGFLIALGLLAAVGAGVAYYLSQQKDNASEDDTDPWAGTTDDGSGLAASASAPPAAAETISEPAAFAADHSADGDDGSAQAHHGKGDDADDEHSERSDEDVAVAPGESVTDDLDAHHESDPEELPKMIDVDDVPGVDAEAQAGFGTDFGDDDNGSDAHDHDRPQEGKHRA